MVFFALGNAWKDKGDLYKAIENFSFAIVINPRNTGAIHNRAVAYYLTKNYDKSWEDVYRLRAQGADIHPQILAQLQQVSGRN
jgi:tetratricopeptide (TPR) repeat protein